MFFHHHYYYYPIIIQFLSVLSFWLGTVIADSHEPNRTSTPAPVAPSLPSPLTKSKGTSSSRVSATAPYACTINARSPKLPWSASGKSTAPG